MQLGDNTGTRKNLQEYTPNLLREFQAIVTSNVVVSYALYAVLGDRQWMVVTVPFVLYVIFRYIYLVEVKGEGGAPEDTLLGDLPILVTTGLYVVSVMLVILLPQPVAT